jgi:hypothetical protein
MSWVPLEDQFAADVWHAKLFAGMAETLRAIVIQSAGAGTKRSIAFFVDQATGPLDVRAITFAWFACASKPPIVDDAAMPTIRFEGSLFPVVLDAVL